MMGPNADYELNPSPKHTPGVRRRSAYARHRAILARRCVAALGADVDCAALPEPAAQAARAEAGIDRAIGRRQGPSMMGRQSTDQHRSHSYRGAELESKEPAAQNRESSW
jgi:hypothetical protein